MFSSHISECFWLPLGLTLGRSHPRRLEQQVLSSVGRGSQLAPAFPVNTWLLGFCPQTCVPHCTDAWNTQVLSLLVICPHLLIFWVHLVSLNVVHISLLYLYVGIQEDSKLYSQNPQRAPLHLRDKSEQVTQPPRTCQWLPFILRPILLSHVACQALHALPQPPSLVLFLLPSLCSRPLAFFAFLELTN